MQEVQILLPVFHCINLITSNSATHVYRGKTWGVSQLDHALNATAFHEKSSKYLLVLIIPNSCCLTSHICAISSLFMGFFSVLYKFITRGTPSALSRGVKALVWFIFNSIILRLVNNLCHCMSLLAVCEIHCWIYCRWQVLSEKTRTNYKKQPNTTES